MPNSTPYQKKRTSEANTIHACSGENLTPEYKTWKRIRQRCRDKNLSHYGAKGITVCARWDKFENFLEDMGKRPKHHTIERINGNLGYSPDNCRWATRKEQQRNIKTNRIIEYKGEKLNVSAMAEKYGLKYNTLLQRLYRGLSVSEAITKPLRRK